MSSIELNKMLFSELEQLSQAFTKKAKGYYYSSMYGFVFKEGVVFDSNALTEEEMQIVKQALKSSGNTTMGECFYNAQCLSMNDNSNSIKYHEGFKMDAEYTMPLFHGFNTINNKVIDITHKIDGQHVFGDLKDYAAYFGVEFDKALCFERISLGKNSTSFIDNMLEGYPVLKSKLKTKKS
jgi:hypothetical protein